MIQFITVLWPNIGTSIDSETSIIAFDTVHVLVLNLYSTYLCTRIINESVLNLIENSYIDAMCISILL